MDRECVAVVDRAQVLVGYLCSNENNSWREFSSRETERQFLQLLIVRYLVCESILQAWAKEMAQAPSESDRILTNLVSVFESQAPLRLVRAAFVQPGKSQRAADPLVDQVCTFVDEHIVERLTYQRIASRFNVTSRHLAARFKRRLGTPLHVHIVTRRVQRGLKLIADGIKVEAAALSVGYRSKKDFYREVRRSTGLTPAQVRIPQQCLCVTQKRPQS